MALRSHLLSVELPDASGKTVPFYTYDGYLEEADRHKLHREKRSFEQLKVTGGAITGFLAYVVSCPPRRSSAELPSPLSHSEAALFPSRDWFQECSEASSATIFSPSTAAAGWSRSGERLCCRPSTCHCGPTSGMPSTPTAPSSNWQMNATTSHSSSTQACSSTLTQDSRVSRQTHP